MKNRVTIQIAGENYVVLTEESEDYMRRVAQMVDDAIGETRQAPGLSLLQSTVLAACNIADKALKAAAAAGNLREQAGKSLKEAEKLRRELAESQRMLDELTNPKPSK